MTNNPNTDKTIEQIRDELADCGAWSKSDFKAGWNAAIQLCEQRERDLVEALTKAHTLLEGVCSNAELTKEIGEMLK